MMTHNSFRPFVNALQNDGTSMVKGVEIHCEASEIQLILESTRFAGTS